MSEAPQDPTRRPLTPAEGEQMIALAVAIVRQANNLATHLERDQHLMTGAVLSRAIAESVCDAVGLDASVEEISNHMLDHAKHQIHVVVAVQAERLVAAGRDPLGGEMPATFDAMPDADDE